MTLIIIIVSIIALATVGYFFVIEYTTKKKHYDAEFRLYSLLSDDLYHADTLDDYYNIYLNIVKYFPQYISNNSSLCANPYGIFRVTGNKYEEDLNLKLPSITKDEIFLGDVNGLWTKSLSYWETCDDKDAVETIKAQFYNVLSEGLNTLRSDMLKKYK